MDTGETFTTRSSIASPVNLTLPNLHASRAASLKAAERDPLVAAKANKQTQLDVLLSQEPPPCDGCSYNRPTEPAEPSTPGGTVAQAKGGSTGAGTNINPPEQATPTTNLADGGNSQWQAWHAAVQALQAEIGGLNTRISTVDAKVYQTTATLSNSPSGLHQPLLHTFDKNKATQELRDGVAVTAAFGKAAYKFAGDKAGQFEKQAKTECDSGNTPACEDAKRWGEGGVYRGALHSAIGGMAFGTAGAVGNAAGTVITAAMPKALDGLGITDPTARNMLTNVAVTLAGAAAGSTGGAAAAFNADANNRQLHPDEGRYIKAKAAAWAARRGNISLDQAEQELTRGALYDNDLKWNTALKAWTPAEIANYKSASDFLRSEASRDNFRFANMDGVQQAGFTSTPEQFQNGRYLLELALKDPTTRQLYVDRAAISLTGLNGWLFAGRAVFPAAKGVVTGIDEQLTAYGKLLDPATYSKLAAAVRVIREQGFQATLNQVFNSTLAGAQSAAYSAWVGWMQSDSEALGNGAGRVLGATLVDSVAMASGIAVARNAGRAVEGVTELQGQLVRRIEDQSKVLTTNKKVADSLAPSAPRVFNGQELSSKLIGDPAAGWDYSPKVVPGSSENLYWSHWVGHQTEVRVASEMADQGQLVVRWGDKIGTTGSDIIAVNPVTAEVTLADTKFSSANKTLKMSDTFDFTKPDGLGLAQYQNLQRQATDAIIAAKLNPALEAKAIQNINAGNFNANTIGAGNYRNSVPMRFCSGKPC
jgi:hypothetical protein